MSIPAGGEVSSDYSEPDLRSLRPGEVIAYYYGGHATASFPLVNIRSTWYGYEARILLMSSNPPNLHSCSTRLFEGYPSTSLRHPFV
ncbi:unnamed protein product [Ectocarpus fasciculatus]